MPYSRCHTVDAIQSGHTVRSYSQVIQTVQASRYTRCRPRRCYISILSSRTWTRRRWTWWPTSLKRAETTLIRRVPIYAQLIRSDNEIGYSGWHDEICNLRTHFGWRYMQMSIWNCRTCDPTWSSYPHLFANYLHIHIWSQTVSSYPHLISNCLFISTSDCKLSLHIHIWLQTIFISSSDLHRARCGSNGATNCTQPRSQPRQWFLSSSVKLYYVVH